MFFVPIRRQPRPSLPDRTKKDKRSVDSAFSDIPVWCVSRVPSRPALGRQRLKIWHGGRTIAPSLRLHPEDRGNRDLVLCSDRNERHPAVQSALAPPIRRSVMGTSLERKRLRYSTGLMPRRRLKIRRNASALWKPHRRAIAPVGRSVLSK